MPNASERAYADIRGLIMSGALPPVPPIGEAALAALCGVSRTPVREAIRRLEAETLIRREGPKRAHVARWSADDLEQAFTLRAMLESHAAARAATRLDAIARRALGQANEALAHAVARADLPAFVAANRAFHTAIVEAAASPRLAALLAGLIEQPVVVRTAHLYGPAELARSHAEHAELIAAFAAADPHWAGAVMTGHIRRAFHTLAASAPQIAPAQITPSDASVARSAAPMPSSPP